MSQQLTTETNVTAPSEGAAAAGFEAAALPVFFSLGRELREAKPFS